MGTERNFGIHIEIRSKLRVISGSRLTQTSTGAHGKHLRYSDIFIGAQYENEHSTGSSCFILERSYIYHIDLFILGSKRDRDGRKDDAGRGKSQVRRSTI